MEMISATADAVCESIGGGDAACTQYCKDSSSGYYNKGTCDSSKTCRCYKW